MEITDFDQLSYLIVSLTTNGKHEFDKANLKKLKLLCKNSNEYLEQGFRSMYSQLEKDHSEIRLSSVKLMDVFFQRSHIFRTLLLERFGDFLELAAGTNFDVPLPEPKSAAQELLKVTVKTIHKWHEKFGTAYKRLALGYNFLRNTKNVRMVSADEVQTEIQRNAAEDKRRKQEERDKIKCDKLLAEIKLYENDIMSCVAEMEACISLLVPKFTDAGNDESDDHKCTDSENTRALGIVSQDYSVNIDIPENIMKFLHIHSSKDNEVILENLKDREMILKKTYLSKVKNLVQQLSQFREQSVVLKRMIDLKASIVNCLSKSRDLVVETDDNISISGNTNPDKYDSEFESSDDEGFIEVPEKCGAMLDSKPSKAEKSNLTGKGAKCSQETSDLNVWKPIRDDDNINDPTSYSRALAMQRKVLERRKDSSTPLIKIHPMKYSSISLDSGSSQSNAASPSIRHAPVVPFGKDLLEWDDLKKNELKETLSLGMARELDIGHRFWSGDTASKGEQVSEAALTALTTRSIPFVGKFEPVNHTCRAPLPSGKLCPRMDRLKCPFHGLIVPRDFAGNPRNVDNNFQGDKQRVTGLGKPDWQDPEYLRELQSATGHDLTMPSPKKKRKRTNLTDVKNMKDTSRHRLEKKVLNPKSIKRVSETLDTLDAKRNFQKFGNNFNYALN